MTNYPERERIFGPPAHLVTERAGTNKDTVKLAKAAAELREESGLGGLVEPPEGARGQLGFVPTSVPTQHVPTPDVPTCATCHERPREGRYKQCAACRKRVQRITPRGVSQEQGGGSWPEKYFRAPRPGGPGTP